MLSKFSKLFLFNSYSDKLDEFKPINNWIVKMYLCGPTVYGLAHIGHARSSVTFDILNRYLRFLGYKVKFVRNYTDVGHLEHDADEGNDKIQNQALKEKLEPMEIVQKYINYYREDMDSLNILRPNIELQATSYINEQIDNVKCILDKGYAYEVNGSVYFDIKKYNDYFKSYGKLSGRNIDELINETRELNNQGEKKNNIDFALWKKADDKHIMKWKSPWGYGYPGWHTECVVLGTKYLGELFDIHGGGYDLKFPHHECEIAQSNVLNNTNLANYWIHNNLVNIDGKKMSKSLNNYITLQDLFYNENNIFNKVFIPMDLRFLFLQTHYRSTLSITKDSLESAHKGLMKLINAYLYIDVLEYNVDENNINNEIEKNIEDAFDSIFSELNNDLNTPSVISGLFNIVKVINCIRSGDIKLNEISKELFIRLKSDFKSIIKDVLGLYIKTIDKSLFEYIINSYKTAKYRNDYSEVDRIRNFAKNINIRFCDSKDNIYIEYI